MGDFLPAGDKISFVPVLTLVLAGGIAIDSSVMDTLDIKYRHRAGVPSVPLRFLGQARRLSYVLT
jgi:hypothetical protein